METKKWMVFIFLAFALGSVLTWAVVHEEKVICDKCEECQECPTCELQECEQIMDIECFVTRGNMEEEPFVKDNRTEREKINDVLSRFN